MPSTFFQDLSA